MFDFIKKNFSGSSEAEEVEFEPEFRTKPCRSCGRPISYNPEWGNKSHITVVSVRQNIEKTQSTAPEKMWKDIHFVFYRPILAMLLPGESGKEEKGIV